MKIVDKSVKDPIDFEDLDIGDVFQEAGGVNIYLSLDTFRTEDGYYFNAVNLYTMEYTTFSSSDRVVKLNAELVIS